MAYVRADRVMESSTTTGTGAFTLAGAIAGFRTFASVLSVSDTVHYVIEAVNTNGVPTGEWETGLGTYSGANTLTRTTVIASSNGGAAVNFSAGTKRVAISNITAALLATQNNLSDLASAATARTNLGLVAGGAGDIWVEKAGDTMTGLLDVNTTGGAIPSFAPLDGIRLSATGSANVRTVSEAASGFAAYRLSANNSPPGNAFVKGRGSIAAPAAPILNDNLGQFTWWGVDAAGTNIITSANFSATLVDTAVSDTKRGTRFVFNACPDGSVVLSELFRLDHTTGLSMFGANTVIDANRLFHLRSYTVATLPTVGTAGRLAKVTDATAPTYNATVTGGGAVDVPVYDNGTNWTSH